MTRGSPGRGPLAVVITLLALAALVGAASTAATAHGNHVTVTPQVVDDAVVVESAYTISGGWIAIARDDGGTPGERIGHVRAPIGTHEAVAVPVDTDVLPADGSVTLWAVLHGDDGDGEFDPGADPVARSFSGAARESVPVRRGDAPTAVVAPSLDSQPTNGTVEVRRVSLASPGHVALHAGPDTASEVVGHTALGAGTHENVSVAIDAGYLDDQPRRFSVSAVAYAGGGSERFGAADPVTVDGEAVASRIDLTRVENGSVDAENATDVGFDPSIVTPAASERAGTDGDSAGGTPAGGIDWSPDLGAAAVVGLAIGGGVLAVRRWR